MKLIDRVVGEDQKVINHIKCNVCQDILVNPRLLRPCSHVCCLACAGRNQQINYKTPDVCVVTNCGKRFIDSDILK